MAKAAKKAKKAQAKKTSKKVVKKPAKKVVKKVVKKPAKKVVKKTAKKIVKKVLKPVAKIKKKEKPVAKKKIEVKSLKKPLVKNIKEDKKGKKEPVVLAKNKKVVEEVSAKKTNAMVFDEEGDEQNLQGTSDGFDWSEIQNSIASLEYFVDPKSDECLEKGCDNIRTTLNYCRLHYIKNWKEIMAKKELLSEGRLQDYINTLLKKYPQKYLEAIFEDLSDEKDFARVLSELNISTDYEEEDTSGDDFDDLDSDSDIVETKILGGQAVFDEDEAL